MLKRQAAWRMHDSRRGVVPYYPPPTSSMRSALPLGKQSPFGLIAGHSPGSAGQRDVADRGELNRSISSLPLRLTSAWVKCPGLDRLPLLLLR